MSDLRPVIPTDPEAEAHAGRNALWLEVEDLRWLAEYNLQGSDASPIDVERAGRVRFRVHAALHKAGLKERNVGEH